MRKKEMKNSHQNNFVKIIFPCQNFENFPRLAVNKVAKS